MGRATCGGRLSRQLWPCIFIAPQPGGDTSERLSMILYVPTLTSRVFWQGYCRSLPPSQFLPVRTRQEQHGVSPTAQMGVKRRIFCQLNFFNMKIQMALKIRVITCVRVDHQHQTQPLTTLITYEDLLTYKLRCRVGGSVAVLLGLYTGYV